MESSEEDAFAVWSWGVNYAGQLGVETASPMPKRASNVEAKRLEQVACGGQFTLALSADGVVYSWGSNEKSQLGRMGKPRQPVRVPALDTMRAVDVAAGEAFAVVLDERGKAFAWGSNHKGEAGVGIASEEPLPKPKRVKLPVLRGALSEADVFVSVACGKQTAAAVSRSGRVYAWGCGLSGQMGDGDVISRRTPSLVSHLTAIPVSLAFSFLEASAVVAYRQYKVWGVSVGAEHCLARTVSGSVLAWGGNQFGQLGFGDRLSRRHPAFVPRLRNVCKVSSGAHHNGAVDEQGRCQTWGQGGYGQLGHGHTNHVDIPSIVKELLGSKVFDVACGQRHTAFIVEVHAKSQAQLFCSGASNVLGLDVKGAAMNALVPMRVPDLSFHPSSNVFSGCTALHSFIVSCPAVKRSSSVHTPYHLSLDSVKRLIQQEDAFYSLRRHITVVFDSPSAMNASFLAPDHMNDEASLGGLDISSVRDAFGMLANASHANRALMDTFQNATSRLMHNLTTLSFGSANVETLRVFFIALENPFLCDYVQFGPALANLCSAVIRLSSVQHTVLRRWWGQLSSEAFQAHITLLNGYISHCYGHPRKSIRDLLPAVSLLQMMYRANAATAVLSHEAFYNKDISARFDPAKDYVSWKSSGHTFCFTRYPFMLTPAAKSALVHVDAEYSKRRAFEQGLIDILHGSSSLPVLLLPVRRTNLLVDAMSQLGAVAAHDAFSLRKPLRVNFEGEEALDAGGPTKEFFQLVVSALFCESYGMFRRVEGQVFWFVAQPREEKALVLQQFWLIGIILGLAVFNSVILDVRFPLVVFEKLCTPAGGRVNYTTKHTWDLFPVLGRSLQSLLDYDGSDVADVFMLSFQVSYQHFGTVCYHDLKRNGADTPVTSENRAEFVRLYLEYLLEEQIKDEFSSFKAGFDLVTGASDIMQIFRPEELELLVCGASKWDFADLRAGAKYKSPYSPTHHIIGWLWEIAEGFDEPMQRKFLRFCTGSDRVPIEGLREYGLEIQRAGPDSDLLPCAHTCFNLLDIPEYSSREKMEGKLAKAVENYEGFGLV